MTRTQKCLALTAVALVAVVSPVVAISALTFPVFGGSVNQNVRQLSFDGASLQEQDENGVISGTCSYEDESGRTVEISYTKSQYGTVNANSPGVRDPYAAYQACIQRVEELKRQQLEDAGIGSFTFTRGNDKGQSSYNTGRHPTEYQGAGQNSHNRGRYPSQSQGAGQNSYNAGRYPSQSQGAGQNSYNRGRYPSQSQGAGQNSYNARRYPSQSQGAGQNSYNSGRYPSQSQGAGQNSYNARRYPSQSQGAGQNSYNARRYPSQSQGGSQASGRDRSSSSQHQESAQSSYDRNPHTSPSRVSTIAQTYDRQNSPPIGQSVTNHSHSGNSQPNHAPATTQTYDRQNYPPQGQSVTRPSYGGNISPNHAQATTQSFADNEGATQSPSGRDVGTPSSSPSLSGTASQSSPSRNNPGQIQMVFQTSGGNSMQFQENASRGVTTGQCAYVDWRGRTIKISYTKHANGKVDVVTDPEVWQPKRAYHTCISKAKEESKRLDSEMAQIESDLRQTEREVQSEVARQEEEAFGWQKHFSAFPVARRKLQRVRDY